MTDTKSMAITPERIEELWREYLPDVPMPTKHWEHWLLVDDQTFVRALEILAAKRLLGRFRDGRPKTPADYAMYLSGILRRIANITVPLTLPMGRMFTLVDHERFSKFVQVSDSHDAPDGTPCHLWTGAVSKDGYGRFSIAGKKEYAHTAAFFLRFADHMPANGILKRCGLEVHHGCRTPHCVNAGHLQLIERSLHRGWRSDPVQIELEDPEDYVEMPDSVVEIEAVEA
jgi:hypothetical protein